MQNRTLKESWKPVTVMKVRLLDYDILSVTYSNGMHATMDAVGVAKAWLTMSNDDFFDEYGFNWIPPHNIQSKARERIKNEYIRSAA